MKKQSSAPANAAAAPVGDDTYTPIQQRWEQVLTKYPPDQEWRVRIDADPAPTPINYARRNPGDPVVPAPTMRFTATLVSPLGNDVASGSTLFIVEEVHDWEAGETNARHRLAVALGFAPRQMGDDESRAQARSGATPKAASPAPQRNTTLQVVGGAGNATPVTAVASSGASEASIDPNDPYAGIRVTEVSSGWGNTPRGGTVDVDNPLGPNTPTPKVDVPAPQPVEAKAVESTDDAASGDAADVVAEAASSPVEATPAAATNDTVVVSATITPAKSDAAATDKVAVRSGVSKGYVTAVEKKAAQLGITVDWSTITNDREAVLWLTERK